MDFYPFYVLKRGVRRSASAFLSLIVTRADFFTNISEWYSGARLLLVDLHIMVAGSRRMMSEIVGYSSLLIRPAAET